MQPNSLPDAIQLVNSNKYGNGTAIFTTSAGVASTFPHEIDDGKVGINIPIPVLWLSSLPQDPGHHLPET
jgi:malonate-semialdehyde dehydrogenase (acetylating)/methylmalonate-semialdehyde dehydrogenase